MRKEKFMNLAMLGIIFVIAFAIVIIFYTENIVERDFDCCVVYIKDGDAGMFCTSESKGSKYLGTRSEFSGTKIYYKDGEPNRIMICEER